MTILEEKDDVQSIRSDKESLQNFKIRNRRPSVLKRRGTGTSQTSRMSYVADSDDDMSIASRPRTEDWGVGDDVRMGLE